MIKRKLAEVLNDLPELCMVKDPAGQGYLMVKRGEKGYWQCITIDPEGFNLKRGITRAQQEAMLAGSIFGFDVPGADPLNCK